MPVIIENLQEKVAVDENMQKLIEQAVDLSMKEEQFDTPSEISILLVDNEYIREINHEHRNIDKPTDVLSFPMIDMVDGTIHKSEGDVDLDTKLLVLGDIIISLEKAKEQAESFGHSYERELAFLVTHGVYHLLGYDHEEGSEESLMFDKQRDVLNKMGLSRG